ncbi:MAG: replication initiation factor domain-containing protein [Deltaproteobacteria bacterium]|nr:MAG: replication initiation factor domain-containing protein [Deltaproteobacteria bacterium]
MSQNYPGNFSDPALAGPLPPHAGERADETGWAFPCMAESVTRHALIPFQGGWTFLLCGLDSFDVGGFVEWDDHWEQTKSILQGQKDASCGKDGLIDILANGRPFMHRPTAKPPNYRFHLQFPEYHLYLAITNPPRKSPNVYLSFNSEALWKLGTPECLQLAESDLQSLGGSLLYFQPSRCDLAADYFIPGDLSRAFLESHKVSRSRKIEQHLNDTTPETFYVGDKGAPIRLRIYDKGKEITHSKKSWFLSLWDLQDPACVWRTEYQVRRAVLKQFGVNTIDDLQARLGGVWRYLTEEWFSLRLPDQAKQDRRTVHPWWEDVQGRADQFGPAISLQRSLDGEQPPDLAWYISHISGCLPSIAARLGTNDFKEAANRLYSEMCNYWFNRDFQEEYAKRAIKLGKHPATGGAHEKEW